MAEKVDVAVIGAGVIGCSVAYYLAKEGIKVALLERESIGSGSSAHATGFISLLGTEFTPGPSFAFGLESYHEFPSLVEELEDATGMNLLYQRRPSLRLALEDSEEELIKNLMSWQQEHVAMHWITATEVHELEPRLTPSLIGAVYEDESAQLDSYRLNLALAAGAARAAFAGRINGVGVAAVTSIRETDAPAGGEDAGRSRIPSGDDAVELVHTKAD